jgi:predicted GNAT family N-acyltransferase
MSLDPRSDTLLIELKSDADLLPEEREIIGRWIRKEFPPEVDPHKWAPLNWRVLARLDGELVSVVEILERTLTVAGRPIRVAGIGNVITPEPWRGRGFATALMRRAQTFACEELGVPFCFLVCEPHVLSFYEERGWQLVEGPLVFDQPAGKVTWEHQTMVLPCAGETWPPGVIDLCGLPI